MDADGYMLLIDKDYERFRKWESGYKSRTLGELYKDYHDWKQTVRDAREKHWFSMEDAERKDISEFMGKVTYFYHANIFAWTVLEAYTKKLQDEYKRLKQTKKSGKRKKSTGR